MNHICKKYNEIYKYYDNHAYNGTGHLEYKGIFKAYNYRYLSNNNVQGNYIHSLSKNGDVLRVTVLSPNYIPK
jgi:hypothetical protein